VSVDFPACDPWESPPQTTIEPHPARRSRTGRAHGRRSAVPSALAPAFLRPSTLGIPFQSNSDLTDPGTRPAGRHPGGGSISTAGGGEPRSRHAHHLASFRLTTTGDRWEPINRWQRSKSRMVSCLNSLPRFWELPQARTYSLHSRVLHGCVGPKQALFQSSNCLLGPTDTLSNGTAQDRKPIASTIKGTDTQASETSEVQ
jgi:hypothetical protein